MTTRLVLEQFTKDEDNQWTLGSPSASTATSMATWQKNADQKKRNEKHKHVSNVTRRGILPKIAKRNR